MITKDLYERKELRELVRDFTRKEIAPHIAQWERDGEVPRELHKKAAELDLLGIGFEHGDLIDTVVFTEEVIGNGGSSGLIAALCTLGIAIPHIWRSGNEDLIERFAKPAIRGEKIGSLAVTEPGAGSDVAAIRTTAVRDGDHYVVNGEKTFITSGCRADFVTTAVRTGEPGYQGISLLVIEDGFTRRKLDKMGWHCSDTAELHFDDVRVPARNLVGEENQGFVQIMQQFQVERITMAVEAYATAQRALDLTAEWVRSRETFGRPLISRQVIRHKLAEMAQKVDVVRTYAREVAARIDRGDDCVTEVCFAKNSAVDACSEVVDTAVQLHGGMGYMRESEVERHYRDARILGIGGGASEVMTELAARRLGYA
ncbi:acyl-CoA dehydrogenase [Lentzea fradiae]|uniref:Acyl-CoA dehydrogenase n=1 Tax=Lentzea fradiae TaxID=200378 RepID=A0A1G7UEL4_9PSEU|nr:acyl-CoA dehydrogenase family protein [Lentzea fradiae]SDG45877.1 acyl-CoA dehydrogenase [Lentzea fradiae]